MFHALPRSISFPLRQLLPHLIPTSYGTLPHLSLIALGNQVVPLGPILGAPLGRGVDRLGRAAEHRREEAALNPPHHDVVQAAGRRSRAKSGTEGSGRRAEGVQACLARHGEGERSTGTVRMQRPAFRPAFRITPPPLQDLRCPMTVTCPFTNNSG